MRGVTDLVDPAVVAYAEEHSTMPPAWLERVDAETRRDHPLWFMMVGRQEGRFLELMVYASGARHVLEIGTFTGYSAIAMAAGLPEGGRITTLEADPAHAELSRRNIAASPHAGRIEVIEGPALDTLAHLDGPFDLVFIDADKVNYDGYYEAVLPKLSERGVILCDNTLYGGGVLPDASGGRAADPNAEALRRFNEKVVADDRVVCALTTIRDGVTLIRRAPG